MCKWAPDSERLRAKPGHWKDQSDPSLVHWLTWQTGGRQRPLGFWSSGEGFWEGQGVSLHLCEACAAPGSTPCPTSRNMPCALTALCKVHTLPLVISSQPHNRPWRQVATVQKRRQGSAG